MMKIREIIWTVSQDGRSITPNMPQDGGYQGEHNVTKVVFNIPEDLAANGSQLYIGCVDCTGGYDKSPALTVENGKVEFLLPRAWTQFGGTSVLTLTEEGDNAIAYAAKARVVYHSRQTATQQERRLIDGFMQAACDAAAESAAQAADSAEQALEDKEMATAAANTAEDAASHAGSSADAAAAAETAAKQYANKAAEYSAESNRNKEDAEGFASAALQYSKDTEGDAKDAKASATAAKQYAEAASGHDTAANQHRSAAEAAATRADSDSKSAESAATNAAASASNAANSAEASRRYSQSAQGAATSALASAQMAAVAADKLSVDTKLDTASSNPVANSAVAGELEQVSAEFLNVHGMMDDFNTDMGRALREIENLKKNGTGGGTGGSGEYNRISVRDYGAVGDGVADDRQAILDAFNAAKTMLPCEVYFPAGTYGISNGITVDMAYGTGGLLVRGAGRDITQIKYLESYDPDQLGNMWYAIRIWPVGMPNAKPAAADDYLHDISITGLSVFDPDPCAHAWHPSKGDPSKEETHGFDLQYIKRVSVTDCNLLYVGDEAIDICGCYDVIVTNNHVEGCPAAGTAGGAISIGDGCKGVVVSGNTVNGSAPDEVLDDGTVLAKNNFGIAVESLYIPVVDVTITGNVVTNIQGHGINLGATNAGSGLTNIIIANNVIDHCRIGIDDEGNNPKQGIKICDNLITNTYNDTGDAGHAIRFVQGLVDVVVTGNTIKNIAGDRAIRAVEINSTQVYADNLLDGLAGGVFFVSGDVTIRDCVIKNAGTVTRGTDGAIICIDGDLKVANCTMKAVANDRGIVGATSVENTDIELFKDGAVASGDYIIDYSKSYRLNRVIGCRLRGRLWIKKDYAVVQGVIIESDKIGNNAITVAANGVSVTGCVIVTTTNTAIVETSGYDCNIFANNIMRRGIITTGAHSVSVNNVDLDDMTATA